MKTIKINLYNFDELSEEAKETALQENSQNTEYFWGDDAIKSLEALAEHFGSKLVDYSIDFLNPSYSKAEFTNSDLSKNEIKKLLSELGEYNKETLKGNGDCKLTGYCSDESAIDGFREAFFEGEIDVVELLNAGFKTWLEACRQDYEYQLSEEAFAEHCEANSFTFEENGTMHNI